MNYGATYSYWNSITIFSVNPSFFPSVGLSYLWVCVFGVAALAKMPRWPPTSLPLTTVKRLRLPCIHFPASLKWYEWFNSCFHACIRVFIHARFFVMMYNLISFNPNSQGTTFGIGKQRRSTKTKRFLSLTKQMCHSLSTSWKSSVPTAPPWKCFRLKIRNGISNAGKCLCKILHWSAIFSLSPVPNRMWLRDQQTNRLFKKRVVQ